MFDVKDLKLDTVKIFRTEPRQDILRSHPFEQYKLFFAHIGIHGDIVKHNRSSFFTARTIRGFHNSLPPHRQPKPIQVLDSRILGVKVAIKLGASYAQDYAMELRWEQESDRP